MTEFNPLEFVDDNDSSPVPATPASAEGANDDRSKQAPEAASTPAHAKTADSPAAGGETQAADGTGEVDDDTSPQELDPTAQPLAQDQNAPQDDQQDSDAPQNEDDPNAQDAQQDQDDQQDQDAQLHEDAQQDDTSDTVAATATGVDKYARRRAVLVAGGVAVIAGLIWFFTSGPAALHKSPAVQAQQKQATGTTKQDASIDINQLAAADQKKATDQLAKDGNLDGFTLDEPTVRVAASGASAVMSRTMGSTCYMYAVMDAAPTAVQVDTSGAACTDVEIGKAQAALEQQTILVEQTNAEAAQAAFTRASDTVVYYASKNFDATGAPSLDGLPADLGSGVRVVANHGSYVTAQTTIGGACKSAELDTDGTLGQIIPCS